VQFIRYARTLADAGARVTLGLPVEHDALLSSAIGVERSLPLVGPLPAFDFHCPMIAVPRVLGTTVETIPSAVPYLSADSIAVERWRTRLANDPRFKVGIVWAGRPGHQRDTDRSMHLRNLTPLASVPNVNFICLQKGDAARAQMAECAEFPLTDFTGDLATFADTAAMITHLDLVISVDTSVAHVAGAIGRPLWICLPFSGDWRWMLNRTDSPWYPTARLFRQTRRGSWTEAVEQMVPQLRDLSAPRQPA
jgi:hypothetical protein